MKNIIIIVILGLFAGIIGGFFSSNYINLYGYNQFENILSGNYLNKTKIIVEKAEEIRIEQTEQIKNVVDLNAEKIVKIYKNENINDESAALGRYFKKNEHIKNGLIITSDGWIITNDFLSKNENIQQISNNYTVIDGEENTYTIDNFEQTSGGLFLHIKNAKELPVTSMVAEKNIKKGEMVVVLNKNGDIDVSYIANTLEEFVKSSDKFEKEIILVNNNKFENSFLFNINGGLIGMSNNENKLFSINNLKFKILNLFTEEKTEKLFWGINYIDLSNVIIASSSAQKKGALLYNKDGVAIEKNSIAEKNGFKKDDIITFIDNKEINSENSLNYILQDYKPGDNIDITYIRSRNKKIISVDINN